MPPIPIYAGAHEIAVESDAYFSNHPDIKRYLETFEDRLMALHFAELGREFVAGYVTSDITSEDQSGFGTARSVVERLLLWCWEVNGSQVSKINTVEFKAFLDFNSCPPEAWVSTFPHRRFVGRRNEKVLVNPSWRPFCRTYARSGMPTENMMVLIRSVCSKFFDFLISKQIIADNPVRHVEPVFLTTISRQSTTVDRGVRTVHLDILMNAAIELCRGSEIYERALFILAMTRYLLAPIRLLAASKEWIPSLGCFVNEGGWFFKPNYRNDMFRSDIAPVFIPFLERYLASRKLNIILGNFEAEPLFTTLRGRPGLSQRQIRNIVKDVTLKAVSMMHESGHTREEFGFLGAATLDSIRDASIRACLLEHGLFETQRRLGNEQIISVVQRSFALAESLNQGKDVFNDV